MITFLRVMDYSLNNKLIRDNHFPATVPGWLVDFHHDDAGLFAANAEFLAPTVAEMGISGMNATSGSGCRTLAAAAYTRLWHPRERIYLYCPERSLHMSVMAQALKWMAQHGDWILETYSTEFIVACTQVLMLDLAEVNVVNFWSDSINYERPYGRNRDRTNMNKMAESILDAGPLHIMEEVLFDKDAVINNPRLWKLELESSWPFTGTSPRSETKKLYL